MTRNRPKTTNGLMKYLRERKHILIKGSNQKKQLLNMGYYHAYKGYRYINSPQNQVTYHDFKELYAVYQFDIELKTIFYPKVMFIETALKNHVLDIVLKLARTEDFSIIYTKILDNYRDFSTSGRRYRTGRERTRAEREFKNQIKRRLNLRNTIYKTQTREYIQNNRIACHFLENGQNIPIWGIFELLTLVDFGYFVSCMNQNSRTKISEALKIRQNDDTSASLPQQLIFAIKDLRNAIAHNDVVFDNRFQSNRINNHLKHALENDTNIVDIQFDTVIDYVILIVYVAKHLSISKIELKNFVSGFENSVNKLKSSISNEIFSKIFHNDYNRKINGIKNYIEN